MSISETFRSRTRKVATFTCVSSIALAGLVFTMPAANAADYANDAKWGTNGQINVGGEQNYDLNLDSKESLYVTTAALPEKTTLTDVVKASPETLTGVTKYLADGKVDTKWADKGFLAMDSIQDTKVASDGTLYILGKDTVTVVDPSGEVKDTFKLGTLLSDSTAVTVGSKGSIFVSGVKDKTSTVIKLDDEGKVAEHFVSPDLGDKAVIDIAVNDGSLYILQSKSVTKVDVVTGDIDPKFAPESDSVETATALYASPTDSDLYIKNANDLTKVDETGKTIKFNEEDGFSLADADKFAVSEDGNLYVTDAKKFGLITKYSVAVAVAVPTSEPTTPVESAPVDAPVTSEPTTPTTSPTDVPTAPTVEAPSAVEQLEAESASATTLDVTWNAVDTDVTGYQVEYQKAGSETWVPSEKISASDSSYKAKELEPATKYNVRVLSLSTNTSTASNVVTAATISPAATSSFTAAFTYKGSSISGKSIPQGAPLTMSGKGAAGDTVNIYLKSSAKAPNGDIFNTGIIGTDGTYSFSATIPATQAAGDYVLVAQDLNGGVAGASKSVPFSVTAVGVSGDGPGVTGKTPTGTTAGKTASTNAEVVYENCAAAGHRILKGEPGYSTKLDRDGDGIACEEYGTLAYTGSEGTIKLVGGGLLLLAFGAGLMAVSMRKRKTYESFLPKDLI